MTVIHLSFALDQFGRLMCELHDGQTSGTATASNVPDAANDLHAALASAESTGRGECWWLEGAGEYRWVIRRDGDGVNVVVLWSAGTITGWEHVFWGQGDFAGLSADIRERLEKLNVLAV